MFTTQKNNLHANTNVQNFQNGALLAGSLICFMIAVILWRYFLHMEVWESALQFVLLSNYYRLLRTLIWEDPLTLMELCEQLSICS